MTVFQELKRRNVFKVATAYLITAWLIIQIVTVLEPYLNLPQWIVPVIFTFLVVGFPISCLFAWAFELTPEGIKRSKEVDHQESITHVTGRKLDFIVIGFMAVAVVFLSYEAYFDKEITAEIVTLPSENIPSQLPASKTLNEQVTSIAVLPFVNMSNDPEQEYFSDGLSEELLNVLARIKQLKVAARTSSFFFKNKNMDIKEIANKLDVKHILEGSVRKYGTKLRVTAQLIQADSGYHLWSETYDYEIDDVFKIQDEISESVVKQLKITLLNEQLSMLTEHGTRIPEAQDAYLKGRYYMRSRTPESLQKSSHAFQQSLQIDGNNQLAVSGLVDTYNLQATYANLTNKDYLILAKPLLQPYFEAKNNSAEIDTSIGSYYIHKVELDKALGYFHSAILKNKNYAQAYHWLGHFYRRQRVDFDKAQHNLLTALKLDPYSEVILLNLFGVNYQQGNILEAENYLHLVNEIAPNASHNNYIALRYYWVSGRDWHKAYEILTKTNLINSQSNHDVSFEFYLALDNLAMAEKRIAEVNTSAAYKANIVFNYQMLALAKLQKQLITETEYISIVEDKISQFPHNDNVVIELDLLLRKQKLDMALEKIEQDYAYLISNEKLHFQELLPAAYYIYILRKQGNNNYQSLLKAVNNKINKLEQMSKVPEIATFYRVMLYSLIGEQQKAIANLKVLYIDSNYYNYIPLLQQWQLFDSLRAEPEFQQIVTVAVKKLESKRNEFLAKENNQVIYNTQ